MLNVVCLKWGANKYSPEYANRLFYAVKRNLTIPFKFSCFTEDAAGIDPEINIIPLKITNIGENVAGWWMKIYMFASALNGLAGRVLYFDLDTLITGNIDHIASANEPFIVLRDFMHPEKNNMGSGVMAWNADDVEHLWRAYYQNNPKRIAKSFHPHGDQRYIQREQTERSYWQDLFPGEVVSYKMHCRDGLPENAKVVCFHGKPSIPESINKTTKANGMVIPPAPWVKEYWKYEL